MLAGFLEAEIVDPAVTAERLGRAWSASLPGGDAGGGDEPGGDPGALDTLVAGLDAVGFDSRAVEDADGSRVEVTHCPFLEVAADHEDVVCGLHLGLMRGVLERTGSAYAVETLEPLVEPGLCLARLGGREPVRG
jgi:predicted ArsR family transcriptional regulator